MSDFSTRNDVTVTDIGDAIFESSNDCVKVLDAEGLLLSMNKNGQCIMEIDDFGSVAGQHWASLWPDASGDAIANALREARAGRTGHFEAFCPTAKSTPKWWDVIVTPVVGAAGQIEKILSISRDVTDVRRANEELRASQKALQLTAERLHVATDAAELGLWAWDPDTGEVTLENARGYDILGLAPSSGPVAGARFALQFLHADDIGRFEHAVSVTVSNERRFKFEGRTLGVDGQERWVEVYGRSQKRPGANIHMVGTIADITPRKRAQQALFESRESLEKIITQAATGVVQVGVDGCLTLVNQKYCDMLGYTESELLGMRVSALTAPGSVAITDQAMRGLVAGGPAVKIEKQYLRKDGSLLWATSSVNALRGPDGAFLGMVAIVIDITERKQAEEKLRDADRRKDEFLAMLAHELRNPLAPIGAAAELLKLGNSDAARVCHTSDIISRQVAHMTNLVDDLLDVSRVTRGLVTLESIALDMRHIVNDAAEQAGPLIRAKHHQLALHLTPDVTTVMGDNKRLVQIVSNLLNNAAKYTPAGGAIVLRTETDEQMVYLTVSDNGVGIDHALAERVFDLFTQAEPTPDRSSGGLGLGLALVKNLVELHGGSVSCHSDGAGQGSAFRVALPRWSGSTAQSGQPATRGRHGRRAARRILLVDDNMDAAVMLGMLLEASGHTVKVVHCAREALAEAGSGNFDVCLLDIGLPEMDGNELARRLRQLPPTAASVLVAITGYGQESDRRNTSEAGFDHHFIKPVDTHKLLALLEAPG